MQFGDPLQAPKLSHNRLSDWVERQRTLEPVPDTASVIESGTRQHPCGTTSRVLTGGRKPFLKAMAFTVLSRR
jgi:hypothetical protein